MAGNGIDIQYQAPDYIKFYKAVKSVDIETQKALRKRLSNIGTNKIIFKRVFFRGTL